jgi:hypothetical protein
VTDENNEEIGGDAEGRHLPPDDETYSFDENSRQWVRNTDGEGPEAAAQDFKRERIILVQRALAVYEEAYPEALTDEEVELRAEVLGGLGECGWHRCSDLKLGNVHIPPWGKLPMVEESPLLNERGTLSYSDTGRIRVQKKPNRAGRMVRVMRWIPR